MATNISMDGNTTSEFKYNTVYSKNSDNNYAPDENIDATGTGFLAYIRGKYVATKFRGENVNDGEIGNIFGGEKDSRSSTVLGNVTPKGSYSYANGLGGNNTPEYYKDSEIDKTGNNEPYTIGDINVLSFRNDDGPDGVSDDKKTTVNGTTTTEKDILEKIKESNTSQEES